LLQFVPRHLRPRREKIFGPAPSHRLDGNAKARVWGAASAYNSTNRKPGQHQGPLTWATLRVLRALARVWGAASAYNSTNRKPGQHQGPLTWATLRVLRALLWRFHGADGGGRHAALIARLDTKPTKADWALYGRELDARIDRVAQPL
jgi:hypothetical protein